jgi:hypothetical protein
MRVYYRIKAVKIHGGAATTSGRRVVFVANHADRRDAVVAFAVSKHLRDAFFYMSNREQLREGTLFTWLLRSAGVFSIARGMIDVSSIKYTTRLLTDDDPARVFLFPEGGAFSRSDAVFPFLTQPFDLILRAQKQVEKKSQSISIIPVAIRYEYGKPEKEIAISIARLERAVGLHVDTALLDVDRLLQIGGRIIESFDRVFDIQLPAYETEVHEKGLRIKKHLIESLRSQMEQVGGEAPRTVDDETGDLTEARNVLNQLSARHSSARTDEDALPKSDYERRLRKQIFDRMTRVFEEAARLENWIGLDRDYFKHANQHRIIDAIIRLEREVFGEVKWSAERTAVVKLGEPIDARSHENAESLAGACRDKIVEMLR